MLRYDRGIVEPTEEKRVTEHFGQIRHVYITGQVTQKGYHVMLLRLRVSNLQ